MPRVVIILILSCVYVINSYKILGIFPHPGKSHVDVFLPIMTTLAKRGHQVTVISHFPRDAPIENYKDVSLSGTTPSAVESVNLNQFVDSLIYKHTNILKYATPLLLSMLAKESCEGGLKSQPIQDFIKNKQQFDLIIAETFNSDCFLGFLDLHKVPMVGLSSCTIMPWIPDRYGEPDNPAFVPNNFLELADKMSFFERVENSAMYVLHKFMYFAINTRFDRQIAKRYFYEDIPAVDSFAYNSSLLLVNTHFSLNLPRPNAPNVIEIGGIHVKEPQQLPTKLEKWVNESTEGVVYFSLGSVIKGHTFPEDKKQAFLRAFGRIPQRVLWKWENDTMPGKPDNVMIQKWMPQLDILCHPNVKAFISHGGLLGTTEAVHCGVPVIVMPQFGDQFTNAKALEANGGGVILHLYEATEEKVYNALKTVLHPDFRKKAKELSERFRDRPLPPLETAIYWVEYVARHKGARHMRTAAVDMPFYQYLLLDVIAFLAAVILLVLFTFYYTIKTILRCIFARNKNKIKTN